MGIRKLWEDFRNMTMPQDINLCCEYTIMFNLPDPVVNVDVGQPITQEVVEEGDVEEASFDPVSLGVAEHKVDC